MSAHEGFKDFLSPHCAYWWINEKSDLARNLMNVNDPHSESLPKKKTGGLVLVSCRAEKHNRGRAVNRVDHF
jgi:hypothetical protein